MKIDILTGQRGTDIAKHAAHYIGDKIEFPETQICHAYDLCENVMETIQKHFDNNEDLVILTYSEVVVDAVRLWVARNKFLYAQCNNVLTDDTVQVSPIDEYGEMDWIIGIFDVKQIILKELFTLRKDRK